MRPPPFAAPQTPLGSEWSTRNGRGLVVLIVDDSELVAERLAEMIHGASLKLCVPGRARSPAEAKQMMDRFPPDVVILDIRMPGGSGIDLLKMVKRSESPPVVIVLTNYPFPQYRMRCMELGAEYFFDKSSQCDRVIEVLLGLLRNRNGHPV